MATGCPDSMRHWEFFLAALGWVLVLTWIVFFCGGGGKDVMTYAEAFLQQPLEIGASIPFSDEQRVMWSGWWSTDPGGFRLSTSVSPDLLFRRTTPASACALDMQAFPMLGPGQRFQAIYAKVNDAPLAGPAEVAADETYHVDGVGSLKEGINVLTFWIPGARRPNEFDERMLALAVRSIKLNCSENGG